MNFPRFQGKLLTVLAISAVAFLCVLFSSCIAWLGAGCATTPQEDRTGMDGNWVTFTNSAACFPNQGRVFSLKKDLRTGLWEIWWWNLDMPREGLIKTDVTENHQRILLAPFWQLVRTNL